MLTCSIGDWTKAKLSCFRYHMTAAVNPISMILVQQPSKEKLLILNQIPIAFTEQILLIGSFLHSANFLLSGKQEL